jgi:hypothetical protein
LVTHCDPVTGLTGPLWNAALRLLQYVYFWSVAMNDVVERILNTYQSMCPLDAEQTADSRQKISRYIESLASAGQRDDEQLTIYGLAYLTRGARSSVHRLLNAKPVLSGPR